MKEFNNAVALVTGGASGIGLGLARALLEAGAKVAIADIDETALSSATASLAESKDRVLPLCLDVCSREDWEMAVNRVESELGRLQILCSNAGVAGSCLPIEQTEWEGWRWTIDVNLHGNFNALRTCVPRIRAHGLEGHIVCTASLGAFLVGGGNGAYCAAKAGVVAMCEALRQELSSTAIGVSVLCPGLVSTNLLDNVARLGPNVELGGHGSEIEEAFSLGMDPAEVGKFVLNGIRDGQFWLFTHPELRDMVVERNDAIAKAME